MIYIDDQVQPDVDSKINEQTVINILMMEKEEAESKQKIIEGLSKLSEKIVIDNNNKNDQDINLNENKENITATTDNDVSYEFESK